MVAKYMGTGYRPGKTPSGEYPQFACDEGSGAIVRALSMHGSNDCVDFHKKNRDKSTFGSFWGLGEIGCFNELKNFSRLTDMPKKDVEKLAKRMYELLFMRNRGIATYLIEPKVDESEPRYMQIVGELTILQGLEKELAASNN
jgi:hypothetical protein